MGAMVSTRDALMPRGPDRIGRGLLLALIVHVGLVIAIAIGVNWRSRAPEAMSAELWSAVPQAAAPRLADPDPQPAPTPPIPPKPVPVPQPAPVPKVEPPPVRETPDAEIAIEKAKREKERKKQLEDEEAQRERAEQRKKDQAAAAAAEKQQQELDRKKKADDAKREAERKKAEDARLAKQRDDNLKRMMGQADASGGSGTAKRSSAPSAGYAGLLQSKIKPNVVYTDDMTINPLAEFEVRTAPNGTVIGTPRLVKSSGVPGWDDAALRAIMKTSELPLDTDGRPLPSPMVIQMRPH